MASLRFTCSARPRPSVGTRKGGAAWWSRDVYHVQRSGMLTLCGRDCSEWLRIDADGGTLEMIEDRNCCTRCAAAVKRRILE